MNFMNTKINKIILVTLGFFIVFALWKGGEVLVFLLSTLGFLVTPRVISNADKLENRRKEQSNFEEALRQNKNKSEAASQVDLTRREEEVDKWLDR